MKEFGQVIPELLGADGKIILRYEILQTKGGAKGATTQRVVAGGAKPSDMRHKIQTQYGKVEPAHQRQNGFDLFRCLFSTGQTAFNHIVQAVGKRLDNPGPDALTHKPIQR